jgi:hypothetical protein
MNCCDYDCTRGPDCPAGPACPPCNHECNQGRTCPARVTKIKATRPVEYADVDFEVDAPTPHLVFFFALLIALACVAVALIINFTKGLV